MTGYIYDSKTHKPLSNQSGDMGFNGRTDSDNAKVNLKSDGILPFLQLQQRITL